MLKWVINTIHIVCPNYLDLPNHYSYTFNVEKEVIIEKVWTIFWASFF